MTRYTPGFTVPHRTRRSDLPPGQRVAERWPVVSSASTPQLRPDAWSLTLTTERGTVHQWDLARLVAYPVQRINTDLHCVTGWSVMATSWRGVSLDHLLARVSTSARAALIAGQDGYTTRIALTDLLDVQSWLVFGCGTAELTADHGGPVRLLVPHLYLFKSVKWLSAITLTDTDDEPGFWETLGRHPGADPWREQRYRST